MAGIPCLPDGFYEHSTLWTDELLSGHLNRVLAIGRVYFLHADKRFGVKNSVATTGSIILEHLFSTLPASGTESRTSECSWSC
ncbi:unnamed protein product [Linum trigynum]|uniref:Uncharacterized protein n=1 Tax=Linum trigynum TaxID=586398 RepID=A0AAV2E0Z6_9ROSI